MLIIMTIKKCYLNLFVVLSVIFPLCGCGVLVKTSENSINLTKSTIYVAADADQIKQFSAQELQKHLNLITGTNIPIVHFENEINPDSPIFVIGTGAPSSKPLDTLATEEACYSIDEDNSRIYLFGNDHIFSNRKDPMATSAYMRNSVGTLFAVYDFLGQELGVKWIKPGDDGITYREQSKFVMTQKNHSWTPSMLFRGFRTEAWSEKIQNRYKVGTPEAFHVTSEYLAAKLNEELIWQRRMKFGMPNRPGYGHAFTHYWEQYGENHPEWFALGKNGKRGVEGGQRADRLKLCISNPELLDAIVAEWKAKWLKDKKFNVYNACPNDSRGYCRCENCCALDVIEKADNQYAGIDGIDPEGINRKESKDDTFETDSKTDRYVYFWNELLKRAKKFNPQAKLIVYIYSDYRYPPRNQILADGIICGFVPRFMDRVSITEQEWVKWKERGMKEVFLRPNDFNDSVGMPMGSGKYIFDKFSLSKKYQLVGSDYDRAYNALEGELSGLARYALAQAHNYPEKSYVAIENEFYATFGDAQNEIAQFYRYWVSLFEEKRLNHVQKAGGFGGRRYLFNNLNKFYQPQDFATAHQILMRALKKNMSPRIRKNIESIILANEHSRLTYLAITTNSSKVPVDHKKKATQALYDFRLANKDKLSGSFTMLFGVEDSFRDVAGIKRFVTDIPKGTFVTLPYSWKFKIDEDNIGLKEGWQKQSWDDIKAKWHNFSIGVAWEQQDSYSSPDLAAKLKNYDGIGWYAFSLKKRPKLKGKKVNLVFEAVDESCWIYLNGKEIGKHLFVKPDDWKTSFSIPLDTESLAREDQLLVVRVEDKLGAGGIWQDVTLHIND